jgi:hypothetical protein
MYVYVHYKATIHVYKWERTSNSFGRNELNCRKWDTVPDWSWINCANKSENGTYNFKAAMETYKSSLRRPWYICCDSQFHYSSAVMHH